MNYLDYSLIFLAFCAVAGGLMRGLISQLIDLVAFVLSLALALSFGSSVGHWVDRFFALPAAYQSLIGFVIVLCLVEGIIRGVLRFMGHAIPGILTASLPNRLLGVIPSFAMFVLTVTIAITAVSNVPSWTTAQRVVQASKLAPIFIQYGTATESIVQKMLGPDLLKVMH